MHWVEELEKLRNPYQPLPEENENVLYIHILDDLYYIRNIQENEKNEKNEKNDQNRANRRGNSVIIDITEGN